MQIWSCHFSAKKLLLPTAYRLESKLIKMEVSALERLAPTHLLASFLNVIFPEPSCLLLSLCKPLHGQPSCLDFPAVSRNQKSKLRQISAVGTSVWAHIVKSLEVDKTHIWANQCLLGVIKNSVICHLPFFAFCSIYSSIWEARLRGTGWMSVVAMG